MSDTNLRPPYGCSDCGIKAGSHGWSYTPTAGLHQWIQPSDELIKLRMLQRRRKRFGWQV